MFLKGQTVTITGTGERTRYYHGWGDGMPEMLGKTFIIDSIDYDGAIRIICERLGRSYKWHIDDITCVDNPDKIVTMISDLKSSKFDPNMLDI